MRGIHRRPVNSPHKGPVTRKIFPFDDVFMRTALEDTSQSWACQGTSEYYRCDSWFLYDQLCSDFHSEYRLNQLTPNKHKVPWWSHTKHNVWITNRMSIFSWWPVASLVLIMIWYFITTFVPSSREFLPLWSWHFRFHSDAFSVLALACPRVYHHWLRRPVFNCVMDRSNLIYRWW